MGNSSTATRLDSSPTSKHSTNTSTFQYAYLNSASQRPRLPCTPRSGKCTKQQRNLIQLQTMSSGWLLLGNTGDVVLRFRHWQNKWSCIVIDSLVESSAQFGNVRKFQP